MAGKKFNKEAFKKNLFWIVLGVFTLCWIIAVSIALMGGNADAQAKYKSAKSAVESAKSKGVKTAAYQVPWKEHGKKFSDHKDVIWKQAWEQQKEMYTWPESMPVASQPLYPDDPFARDASGQKNITEDQKIRSIFRTWYKEQFAGIDQIVYPAEFQGGLDAVFPEQKWDGSNPPTAEEIWLAQEDYWVRREMLYLVRQAMDAVALFGEVTPAKQDKLPEGILSSKVFRNANWELTLLIERGNNGRGFAISDKSTIKNINVGERTQVLANPRTNKGGLPFRLIQGATVSEIRISGEPVPFDQTTTLKNKYTVSPVDLSKPFLIEQILDWQISPVRRIDLLALARHSHRTSPTELKFNPELKKLEPEEPPEEEKADGNKSGATPPGGAMVGGMRPPGMPGASGGMPGASGGMPGKDDEKAAAVPEFTSINKIPRNRYLHVTPQCRHLPFVMRLVVDQAHIHDILASMSNSRLRLQITQVAFHHVRDVNQTTPATDSTTPPQGDPTTPPGRGPLPRRRPPGMPSGVGYPGMSMPMMPGMMASGGAGRPLLGRPMDEMMGKTGPTIGAKGAAATSTAQVIDNARLVELSIYGIASLYERFPPKQKPTETAPTTTPTTR